ALLGAAGLRDIGYWFPDNAQETEGMAGSALLARTVQIIKDRGFAPHNVDATIVAQRPKLAPFIDSMKAATSAALGIPVSSISIKATTEEGLGITGSGEAISCFATATVR
ncbi:MAG: 2-C-methyl-D-erythritol 2,4-cyclodiphosphate synthase, partial [Firmicutes bacterium]|nr:2-C-methyl-D-erythritol 2,4-cyclodiphosphate synthase [Bacillota bacterium]